VGALRGRAVERTYGHNERRGFVAYPRRVAQHQESTYSELLTVPWWSWPLAIGAAAIASAEIFLGANPLLNWIPYAILIPATIYGMYRLGAVRITVDGPEKSVRELRVDDAHIPVSFITEVNVLNEATKRELLGPAAAPYVFVIQRPWVSQAVHVVIDDPADPTPYWVISTRRPEKLVRALDEARAISTSSTR
jgi:hypothetical protein